MPFQVGLKNVLMLMTVLSWVMSSAVMVWLRKLREETLKRHLARLMTTPVVGVWKFTKDIPINASAGEYCVDEGDVYQGQHGIGVGP